MPEPNPSGLSAVEWGGILSAIGGTIVIAVKAVWSASGVSRKEEIATLKAELKHERDERERERAEARESLKKLGEKHDALLKAREEDQRKTTRWILALGADSESASPTEELPTGVHRMLDLVPPALRSGDSSDRTPRVRPPTDSRYRHSSDDSVPPGEQPIPPRPKMPSRSR